MIEVFGLVIMTPDELRERIEQAVALTREQERERAWALHHTLFPDRPPLVDFFEGPAVIYDARGRHSAS